MRLGVLCGAETEPKGRVGLSAAGGASEAAVSKGSRARTERPQREE